MPRSKPRRSPSGGERQRDPERTRALILDAAVAEFAARGFAGARTSEIAARAGVNQQLIWYYFDSKQGLYHAVADRWRHREEALVPPDTPLPTQLGRYALEAEHNPDNVRLLAWGGLEYDGPQTDPDHAARAERLRHFVEAVRRRQDDGLLPTEVDPACLAIALMAAAMAPVSLPHVIEGLLDTDPRAPEFIQRYAEQIAVFARLLGLGD